MDRKEQINELQSLILEAEAELASKDYMTIRESEGGAPMPDDVKARRATLRIEINDYQVQIKSLLTELETKQEEAGNGNIEG